MVHDARPSRGGRITGASRRGAGAAAADAAAAVVADVAGCRGRPWATQLGWTVTMVAVDVEASGRALWTTLDRRIRSVVEVSRVRTLPAVAVAANLDDADGWLSRRYVVLDADQMRMTGVGSVVMYSGHVVVALVGDRLGMRRRDRRSLRDGGHMVRLLRYKRIIISR